MIFRIEKRSSAYGNAFLRSSLTVWSSTLTASLSQLEKNAVVMTGFCAFSTRFTENTTSSAVTGFPSLHFAPERSFTVQLSNLVSFGSSAASAA